MIGAAGAIESDIQCDGCSADVPDTEVVVLDGMLYGVSCGCGWRRAAEILEPLLCHSWTPADIATSLREYEEALRVVSFLRLRIHDRLTRRV